MSLLTGLLSHWSLDEASGNRADSVGGITLTDNGGVGSATGKLDGAADFIADTSVFLEKENASALSLGDTDWTWSAWVYFDSLSGFPMVLAKHWNGGVEYELFQTSNSLTWRVASGVTNYAVVAGSLSTGTWYHIVWGHDAANDLVFIRVNNGTRNTTTTGGAPANQYGDNGSFALGVRGNAHTFPLDGRIDQVDLWGRVLTTGEEDALWNSGNGLAFASYGGGSGGGPYPFHLDNELAGGFLELAGL
jgi:hypothetical protein